MPELNDNDRKSLIKLANSIIKAELFRNIKVERPLEIPDSLKEKRGCFVTLHIDEKLRGCIGTIEPVRSLIDNVEANALNAAFKDPRFPPLQKDEFSDIELEISVLTKPVILSFESYIDLIKKIEPGIHGVIISQGWRSATFLPQVWEQLPDKEIFLQHLCRKGGMGKNCWKEENTIVKIYTAEYFTESSINR